MGHKLNRTTYARLVKLLKEGSYDSCCTLLEEAQLIPVVPEQSFCLLTLSVHNPKNEKAAQHHAKFINYITLRELEKQADMRNYLLSVYHIFKILIIHKRWKCMISLKHLLEITEELTQDNLKLYTMTQKQIFNSFHTLEVSNLMEVKIFINIFLKYAKKHNFKEFLLFLQHEATILTKSNIGLMYAPTIIDCLIVNECNIFTFTHFHIICDILRKTYLKPQDMSTKHEELSSCIDKLYNYGNKTQTDKSFLEMMEYFVATKEFYLTINQRNFQDPEMFMKPIFTIRKAYESATSTIRQFLEEIVAFSVGIFISLRTNDRELIKTLKPIKYTKELSKSLSVFISHAKSQSIILESMKISKKCCCSISTNLLSAIQAQTYAMEFITMILRKVEPVTDITIDIPIALYKLMKKILESLETLKKANCTHFGAQWEHVYALITKICFLLAKAHRKDVNYSFVEALIKFAFTHDRACFHKNEANTTHMFYYLADSLVGFKRWKHVLDVCVLGLKMFKGENSVKYFAPVWNTAIYNSKITTTWCDTWTEHSKYLKSLNVESIALTQEEKVYLLTTELTNYALKYKNIKQIQLCMDTLAKTVKLEEFLAILAGLSMNIFHICSFTNVLKNLESANTKIKDKTLSGILNYLIYKNRLETARKEVKNYPKVAQIEIKKENEFLDNDANEDEKFDNYTNYSHVNIKSFEKITTPLKESLQDFLGAFDEETLIQSELILEIVLQLADEFAMHCDDLSAYSANFLAVKLAKTMKSYSNFIQAASKLINTEYPSISQLIKEGLDILESETIDDYTRLAFHTELAIFYLRGRCLEDFRSAYHTAYSLYCDLGCTLYSDLKEERSFERDYATAHFTLLIGEMEFLPCHEVRDEIHGTDTFQMPMLAFDILQKHVQHWPAERRTQLYVRFFNLGEHIVWKHYWSGMLRDAMMYAKNLAAHAEYKILTFRLCRLLIHMGKIKSRAVDMDTCQVISSGLEDILRVDYFNKFDDKQPERGTIMLRDTSPTVLRQFVMPEFVKHVNCTCLPCSSHEYQTSLLEKYRLDAVIAEHYKDVKLCSNLLQGCFKLYRRLTDFRIYTNDVYAELLWTRMKICKDRQDMLGFDKDMAALIELFQQRRCRNLYLLSQFNLMRAVMIVEETRRKLNTKASKSPKLSDCDHQPSSPIVKTPEIRKPRSEVKKSQFLDVPESISTRTRVRGRKNLFDDCSDKSSEGSVTLKVGKRTLKKTTKSTHKPLR